MPKKHRSQRAAGAPTKLCHRTVMMYPVYAYKAVDPEVVLGESPVEWIDKETRNQRMDEKSITSYSRGKMARYTRKSPPKAQPSITLTGVAEGVAEGKPYALSILAAYGPRDRKMPRWEKYGSKAA